MTIPLKLDQEVNDILAQLQVYKVNIPVFFSFILDIFLSHFKQKNRLF